MDGRHTGRPSLNRLSARELREWPSRQLKIAHCPRFHAHGLIAKIPHSRRWRVTKHGRIAMSAAVQLRDVQFPISHLKAAA